METEMLGVITAIGSTFAALGTVGALFAAIATLRYESAERRRSEVRGVRTVLDWGEAEWVQFKRLTDPDFDPLKDKAQKVAEARARNEEPPKFVDTVSPIGTLENGTDESIYDVRVALRPIRFFRMRISGRRPLIEPGGTYELPAGLAMDERVALWDPDGLKPGVEAVFTDSRGTRWNRTRLGL